MPAFGHRRRCTASRHVGSLLKKLQRGFASPLTIADVTVTLEGSVVVGREHEIAEVQAFVAGLEAGPSALVLEGEAGVGKTTLWLAGEAAARARGHELLVTRPAEAEAGFAFAGLGDLLGGVLDEVLDGVPGPQADALRVALLLERAHGRPPEHAAIALATVGVLRALAVARPVLLAVDDVQWLDTPSAAALSFAWRRLRGERVGFLLTRRVGVRAPLAEDDRMQRLEVGALSVGAIHQLLSDRLNLVLPRPTLRRVHEAAGGNPFFALELGRGLQRKRATSHGGEPLPVPERLQDLMHDRLASLPDRTREALPVVAALSRPTPALVSAATGDEAALRPALGAHVLELEGERLRFSHPLLASVAYQCVDALGRRALHRRLAALVGEEEERARHLALGSSEPSEAVAAALDRAAAHARARGASATAADLCEQACRLTPPDSVDDVAQRQVAAARYRFAAGDTHRARELLEQAVSEAASPARGRALAMLGQVHELEGHEREAVALFRRALAEAQGDELARAEAAIGLAATLMRLCEDMEEAMRHAELAAALAERAGQPHLRAHAFGTKCMLQGRLGRFNEMAALRAAAELGEGAADRRLIPSLGVDLAVVLLWRDEHREAAVTLRRIYADAVARGDEGSTPLILSQLALAERVAGRLGDAATIAEEAIAAAEQTGQENWLTYSRAVRALMRASLGQEAAARSDAEHALQVVGEQGSTITAIHAVHALGLLELSLEHPTEAVRSIEPLRRRLLAAGVREPGMARFIPDEIEALIALGRAEEATSLLEWLEARAAELGRESAIAAAERCRGLLAATAGDPEGAFAAFERALASHERLPIPFEHARTLLALGAAQRRAKRKAAARETLDRARERFDELGAVLWSAKARAELARITGRAPSAGALTATERRVAELAAGGASNKEIAAALFVTPKTVETQLSRIYAKLGIHSRMHLAARLTGEHEATKL
jgi:DNA-binding CsgD family transcriptional regulator/Tfp pilus assembly protein PilF